MNHLAQIADEHAARLVFITHFHDDSAALLAAEIKSERDIVKKITKLLHVLTDTLSAAKLRSVQTASSDFAFLVASVRAICPDAPTTIDDFIQWLPQKIKNYRKQVWTLKNHPAHIKSTPVVAVSPNSSISDVSPEEIATMRERMDKFQNIIANLKEQLQGPPLPSVEELNRQIAVLTARYQEQSDLAQKLRLENEVLTARISAEGDQESELIGKYRDILAVNGNLNEANDRLEEMVKVMRAELKTCHEERQKMQSKVSELEQRCAQSHQGATQKEVENASLLAKIADIRAENARLSSELAGSAQRSIRMTKECAQIHGRFVKLKDQTGAITCRLGTIDDQVITLQKFGFMLADALCVKFNPQLVEQELQRLIEIVREEHIIAAEGPSINPPLRYAGNLAREFANLDREISGLESRLP
jgi:DNA repair exonuclease SbcCD ATPase subunit